MRALRILIADDHAIVREGIRQLINAQPGMEVVGEAVDGIEVLNQAKTLLPDVTVIDIGMPKLTGLEAIGMLKDAAPDNQIVVLTMHSQESFVHQALKYGAMGYVLKASPSADIIRAIKAAASGEFFLSAKIRANVIDTYLKSKKIQPTVRGYDLLSEREQQVFRLVVEGSTTKEIADILSAAANCKDVAGDKGGPEKGKTLDG